MHKDTRYIIAASYLLIEDEKDMMDELIGYGAETLDEVKKFITDDRDEIYEVTVTVKKVKK